MERCHAVGYPWFAETRSRVAVRDTVDAIGVVPVLSNLAAGLLSVQVTVAPRALPPQETALGKSEWSGMSGAPVVAAGCLLGVVTEHAPRQGPSAITAVPLTALQADPAHEQWGPGVSDPAAWWARLGVSGIKDLQRLPVPPPRQPPAYQATLREFGRALHQRMPQLLGRERELAEIAAFATGGEGYRWLMGGAFAGKSALLYEAVTVGLPDEVDVVCYFLSRRASDASSGRFLAAVVPQLAYLCEVDAPEASVDRYHALWEQAASRAVQSGRHLLLVVNGLDEDLCPPESPSVTGLLPRLVGVHAHVLVTSRPRPDLPADVPDGHPLKITAVPLNPFEGAQQLADLAKQEIYNLTHGDNTDLAVDVLGLLTAAAGPLSVRDLAALRSEAPTAADTRQVRRLVDERAARSLERVGSAGTERYEFAHASLLEYAHTVPDLCDGEYRQRIHHWASRWRDASWPVPVGEQEGTPQYLLDTYPATLAQDPRRLSELASDIGWAEAAIASAGVDRVLADLRRAAVANSAATTVAAVVTAVTGQAYELRPPQPVDQPGYILRQLWMQAAELAEDDLAEKIRSRMQSRPGRCPVPQWTTRQASRALSAELGRQTSWVNAVAVLADGRVVTGGDDGRVLVWDPAIPGAGPAELGRHDSAVSAVAVLADGRVVTGGNDGRVLAWDPVAPEAGPAELGRHHDRVNAVAVLADGRVVTGGDDRRVLIWDPAAPGAGPAELGRHDSWVSAVAVVADGRVVTGGYDGRVLIWDPAAPEAGPAELGRHYRWVSAVAVVADGRVVTGGDDGRVLVWDPAAPEAGPAELGRHDSAVSAVAVVADGRVVTGGNDGRVLVWDPAAPEAGPSELGRHDSAVSAVAVLADGRVVTGGNDGRVLIWDPAAPEAGPAELGRHDSPVNAVAVLADGRVVTGGRDRRALIWDPAAPGAGPAELGRHDSPVNAVAVLADGRVVTGGDDRRVLIWDPAAPGAGPAELGRYNYSPVNAVAVLADGRVVTGGNDGRVLAWDPAAPEAGPAELGRHHDRVNAVAVLADGRVVTGGRDRRVLIWGPAAPGAGLAELGRHDSWVNAVAVVADGRVVTGGNDGRVLAWDPAAPEAGPAELGRHDGPVNAVAVLADGRVVTGGRDWRVLVWDPARPDTQAIQLSCPVTTLTTVSASPARSDLVIAHEGSGFSLWSFTG